MPKPDFQSELLAWFDAQGRDLPWRSTLDPYAVWVSETMLQQTQVSTVIPFWRRWMERFPTVDSLAAAPIDEAMALWQGLGYYRRCRYLHEGARWVVEHGFPTTAAGWRKVPGVGAYTAAAIASIAYGEPAPLVDGNVERVYARIAGDAAFGPERHRAAWEWASKNMAPNRPGDWNQALMELGATVCRPSRPACPECPVRGHCFAFATGRAEELPTPTVRPKPVELAQVVWIPECDGQYGVRQILEGPWWRGMWEFPRASVDEEETLRAWTGPGLAEPCGSFIHTVTRHRITLSVCRVRCSVRLPELRWESATGLASLPMPAPQRRAFKLAFGSD